MYFLVISFSKQEDERFKTHIYPTYLTSYKKDMHNLGTQAGLCDALKFVNETTASEWKNYAEKTFPNKEFRIIKVDELMFGKIQPKFVIIN